MKPPTDRRCQHCGRDGHAWFTLDSGRVLWLCKGTSSTAGCGTDHWLRQAADRRIDNGEIVARAS